MKNTSGLSNAINKGDDLPTKILQSASRNLVWSFTPGKGGLIEVFDWSALSTNAPHTENPPASLSLQMTTTPPLDAYRSLLQLRAAFFLHGRTHERFRGTLAFSLRRAERDTCISKTSRVFRAICVNMTSASVEVQEYCETLDTKICAAAAFKWWIGK